MTKRVMLSTGQAGYPSRLDGAGAPVLRVEGVLPALGGAVAVVGARAATRAGLEAAWAFGHALAQAGRAVISGGALGIDASAHRGALAARGAGTVAVLGSGLDRLYPTRNRPLFSEIAAAPGGAVVSPFEDAAPPRPGRFLARNRVIAALADATVVVEAGTRSGALATARAARELGRLVLAVPGSPGTDALVARGAPAVEAPADLLGWLARYRNLADLPGGQVRAHTEG